MLKRNYDTHAYISNSTNWGLCQTLLLFHVEVMRTNLGYISFQVLFIVSSGYSIKSRVKEAISTSNHAYHYTTTSNHPLKPFRIKVYHIRQNRDHQAGSKKMFQIWKLFHHYSIHFFVQIINFFSKFLTLVHRFLEHSVRILVRDIPLLHFAVFSWSWHLLSTVEILISCSEDFLPPISFFVIVSE